MRDIQVFLGFTGFYQQFIQNYTKVYTALTNRLTKKLGREPVISSTALEAFQRLKELFLEAPILQHFDPSLPIRIETDASNFAIRAVLCQLHRDE